MSKICIVGDAHLLAQAEWIEDERILSEEVEETLLNFQRAIDKISKESLDAVIFAGDIFDQRTFSNQRVAHREAEKYMITIRQILGNLAGTGCKIFAIRGNHDSEPVLRSLEQSQNGQVVYPGTKTVRIGDLSVAFMDTHYMQGNYDIPLEKVPEKADVLVMHESVPLFNTLGPARETFVAICKRFGVVLNGHVHFYVEKALDIPNFYLIPALIPSRIIKENWMISYRYEKGTVTLSKRASPFGYVLFEGDVKFKRYEPTLIVTKVELLGESTNDFLKGIDEVYSQLMARDDKAKLRVYVRTNADRITVDRVLKKEAQKYAEIRTIEFQSEPHFLRSEAPVVEEQFRDVAFSRDELIEKFSLSLKGHQLEFARKLFDEILTPEFVLANRPDERAAFQRFLGIISRNCRVSEAFVQRAWNLAKESTER
jgi:predicted phosphodiesterase